MELRAYKNKMNDPLLKTERNQETRKTLNTIHRTKNTDPQKKLLLLDERINNKNVPTVNQTLEARKQKHAY